MIFFLTAIAVAVIDQLTKLFVYSYGISKTVISNFLYIRYTENTGAGFGFLQGQNSLLAWLMLIFIGLVLYYYDRIPEKKSIVVFASLVLGGAVGNFIDRIYLGFVRDFIAFTFWPSFNIADAAITIGGIGLIIYLWQKK
ncbi:signal peptidase II [Candidatus Woesearchaeota archaeon]|nr:signal peptidase II [Candidatus Woesearchaeota archaeon]